MTKSCIYAIPSPLRELSAGGAYVADYPEEDVNSVKESSRFICLLQVY